MDLDLYFPQGHITKNTEKDGNDTEVYMWVCSEEQWAQDKFTEQLWLHLTPWTIHSQPTPDQAGETPTYAGECFCFLAMASRIQVFVP